MGGCDRSTGEAVVAVRALFQRLNAWALREVMEIREILWLFPVMAAVLVALFAAFPSHRELVWVLAVIAFSALGTAILELVSARRARIRAEARRRTMEELRLGNYPFYRRYEDLEKGKDGPTRHNSHAEC